MHLRLCGRVAGAATLGLVGCLLLGACSGPDAAVRSATTTRGSAATTSGPVGADGSTTTTTAAEPAPGPTTPAARGCLTFGPPLTTGHLANPAIDMSAGLVASPTTAGVYWTHNDAGDARLFAIDVSGGDLGSFPVENVGGGDWEDIGAAVGPSGGTGYLFLADIGATSAPDDRRAEISVWKIPEPSVVPGQPARTESVPGAQRIDATYPEGEAHDAESLFVDPRTSDIYVITKQPDGQAQVFQLPAALQIPGIATDLRKVAALQFPPPLRATGAAINAEGSQVAVRSHGGFWVFHRGDHQDVAEALAGAPCKYEVPDDGQGEGIAFVGAGRSVLLTRAGSAAAVTAMGPVVDRPVS